jgi:hypothetical protein
MAAALAETYRFIGLVFRSCAAHDGMGSSFCIAWPPFGSMMATEIASRDRKREYRSAMYSPSQHHAITWTNEGHSIAECFKPVFAHDVSGLSPWHLPACAPAA